MTRPAGRSRDQDICPKHASGEQSPTSHDVNVNGRLLVYATSPVACPGCPDFVVTGSGTVKIANQPVARAFDRTMHGGEILTGSADVNVGGPNVGATLGYPAAANAACRALAAGRKSGGPKQTYGNCGIESSRLIINKVRGANHTEAEVFGHAVDKGYVHKSVIGYDGGFYFEKIVTHRAANGDVIVDGVSRGSGTDMGGLLPSHQSDLMNDYGVPSETMDQTMDNVIQAAAEGKGVITWNDAGPLWGTDNKGTHAVNVTGVTYDANGKVVEIITADTGNGDCRCAVPRDRFEKSFVSRFGITEKIAVTKEKVWP